MLSKERYRVKNPNGLEVDQLQWQIQPGAQGSSAVFFLTLQAFLPSAICH